MRLFKKKLAIWVPWSFTLLGACAATSLQVVPSEAASPPRNPEPCSEDQLRARLSLWASGLRDATEMARLQLGPAERHLMPVEVAPNACALISAFGGCGVGSLALRITESGILSSLDSMGRTHAHGMVCAGPQPVSANLWLEITQGHGQVVVTRVEVPSEAKNDLSSQPLPPPLSSPPTLEDATRLANETMVAQGFASGSTVFSQPMKSGDSVFVNIETSEGKCLSLHAVGDPDVADIDLELFDSDDRLLAADRRPMPLPRLGLCPPSSSTVRVRIICMDGQGEVRLLSHELAAPESPKDTVAGIAEALLRNKLAAVGMTENEAHPVLSQTQKGTWSAHASLESDQCYGIAVLSESTALEEVEVLGSDGHVAASWKGPGHQAVLTLCPNQAIQATIAASGVGSQTPRLLFVSTKPAP